ncbi:hypothetical protein [Paenibacillus sp. FSL K6-2859]|uniref:hypothetical protein n=1 Tax=Paenibacillus sp. FSL K6-2859 TaxID=2921482 RepID=UPI0030F5F9A5
MDALNVNVMSHTTNVEDYHKFTTGLQREAGFTTQSTPKFDEAGFNLLRDQMTAGRV